MFLISVGLNRDFCFKLSMPLYKELSRTKNFCSSQSKMIVVYSSRPSELIF